VVLIHAFTTSILIYERDIHLLNTRCLMLVHAAFEVATTLDLGEAASRIDADFVDLLILCHTLFAEECTSIPVNVHSLRPRMKTLILSTSRSGCESREDFVLRTFASPLVLISTVCGLMNMSSVSA